MAGEPKTTSLLSPLTVYSAMEIVTKLCDEAFARRARVGDFFSRAWDVMRAAGAGDGDKV